MNFKVKNYVPFYQEGGEMATPPEGQTVAEPAPASEPQGGQDPMEQLIMAAQQALQTQDANLAMQVCQALVQMAGGGEAPTEQEPVYRKGGILVRRVSRS